MPLTPGSSVVNGGEQATSVRVLLIGPTRVHADVWLPTTGQSQRTVRALAGPVGPVTTGCAGTGRTSRYGGAYPGVLVPRTLSRTTPST